MAASDAGCRCFAARMEMRKALNCLDMNHGGIKPVPHGCERPQAHGGSETGRLCCPTLPVESNAAAAALGRS
jgi:hypothetical protein